MYKYRGCATHNAPTRDTPPDRSPISGAGAQAHKRAQTRARCSRWRLHSAQNTFAQTLSRKTLWRNAKARLDYARKFARTMRAAQRRCTGALHRGVAQRALGVAQCARAMRTATHRSPHAHTHTHAAVHGRTAPQGRSRRALRPVQRDTGAPLPCVGNRPVSCALGRWCPGALDVCAGVGIDVGAWGRGVGDGSAATLFGGCYIRGCREAYPVAVYSMVQISLAKWSALLQT